MTGQRGHKLLRRICFIEGYIIRRIFGYGVMDEVLLIGNGMWLAEERERMENKKKAKP